MAPPDEDGSRIDVLVVYTPAAKEAEGGSEEIEALIDLYAAETNQAFATGEVNLRLHLVATLLVEYQEANQSGSSGLAGNTDRSRLQNPDDGHLDEVHDLRDQHAADIVVLVGHYTDETSGVAAGCPGPRRGCAPEESRAFFVVDHEHSGIVFAHELGHTMALNHDRYAATPEVCGQPPRTGSRQVGAVSILPPHGERGGLRSVPGSVPRWRVRGVGDESSGGAPRGCG